MWGLFVSDMPFSPLFFFSPFLPPVLFHCRLAVTNVSKD